MCSFSKCIREFRTYRAHYELVYCRMLFGCKKQPGCTRLYSAWRKWTSDSHAYSFSPYCSCFNSTITSLGNQQPPKNKLASRVQGLLFQGRKKREEGSVYSGKGLHRQFPGILHVAPRYFFSFVFASLSHISSSVCHTVLPHSKHRHPGFPSEQGDCLQLGCIENILILCRRLEQTNYIILRLHSFHPTDVFISFPSPRLA